MHVVLRVLTWRVTECGFVTARLPAMGLPVVTAGASGRYPTLLDSV